MIIGRIVSGLMIVIALVAARRRLADVSLNYFTYITRRMCVIMLMP